DEVIAIKASGQVTRSSVAEVNPTGRDTMGVKFVGVRGKDEVIAIALNPEKPEEEGEGDETEPEATDEMGNAVPATDVIEADASEDAQASDE
ncbi:MAG: hypothetical protein WAX29_03745, partial [Propionibacterium sp.]